MKIKPRNLKQTITNYEYSDCSLFKMAIVGFCLVFIFSSCLVFLSFFLIACTKQFENAVLRQEQFKTEEVDCHAEKFLIPDFSLPTLHIITDSTTKINHEKEIENHFLTKTVNAIMCEKTIVNNTISVVRKYKVEINSRGHVTQLFTKKQYNLNFMNGDNYSKPFAFLNLDKHWRYVLNGPFIDTSFMRNTFSFHFHKLMGGLSPKYQYVNVFINNEDLGLYYVVSKVGDKQFLSTEKPSALVSQDWCVPGSECYSTPITHSAFKLKTHDKKKTLIIKKVLNKLEYNVQNQKTLSDIIDLQSIAKYVIIEELAKDADGYAFSNSLYLKNGKLFHGSVWDWHLGYGFLCNPLYFTNIRGEKNIGFEGWNADNDRFGMNWLDHVETYGMNIRLLWHKIFHNPEFLIAFKNEWKSQRNGALHIDKILQWTDTTFENIKWSVVRDQVIWESSYRCFTFKCCDPFASKNFKLAKNNFRTWLIARINWIDANIDTIATEITSV